MSSFLQGYEKENIEKYKNDIYTVEIVQRSRTNLKYWYNVGERYRVRYYRSNPKEYWELADWDGDRNFPHFWIERKDTIIIDDKPKQIFDIPDELFD